MVEEEANEAEVARIDETLRVLQRAIVDEEGGREGQETAAPVGSSGAAGGRLASPVRRSKRSPRQRRRRQPASSRGAAPALDASAYATAHAEPAARSARRSIGSPSRQVRSPRRAGRSLGSPTDVDFESVDERVVEERKPSFGASAGRFQDVHSGAHFMQSGSLDSPGPAAYGSMCDVAAAQRSFGTVALISPERRRSARLGSPSRSARLGSPSRSARLGSPSSRSTRALRSPARRAASGAGANRTREANTDMIATWWQAHHALAGELWGSGAKSRQAGVKNGGGSGGMDPSDEALGAAYLGLYGVLRRTAVRAHIKVNSAVVGSLNPGAVIEVLEARVLMPGAHKGTRRGEPRIHVRLRSRYGKSSMAICGWACSVASDGHTMLEKLPGPGQQPATAVTVKKKKKKRKKKKVTKKKSRTPSAADELAVSGSANDGSLSGRSVRPDQELLTGQMGTMGSFEAAANLDGSADVDSCQQSKSTGLQPPSL